MSISYLFYLLYSKYLFHKRRNQEIFNVLLQAISHRFGNFIAVQKLNLEALNTGSSELPLYRLQESLSALEEDYKQILRVLENFSNFSLDEDKIDFSLIIRDLVKCLRRSQNLSFVFRDFLRLEVSVPRLLIRTILSLLLENAFKYAQSFVYVRIGCVKKQVYIFIANDIAEHVPRGSGMGLKIATLLVENLGWSLRYRSKSTFQVLLTGSPKVRHPSYLSMNHPFTIFSQKGTF